MRIGPTRLVNFGPFEDVGFDFSKPGLTGIEGVMHDRPGCTSNGSGKSYLFGGIAWVLFDDPMRDKYAKDDLIRLLFRPVGGGELEVVMDARGKKPRRPPEGCWGRVHVVGGVHDICVERYRGHPQEGNKARLIIDGVDRTRGRDVMTNEAIVEAIGMDYQAFAASIAFGTRADVKGFFSATDKERKAILDKLLGMEVYAQAQRVAREKLREVAKELEIAERAKGSLEDRIAEQERTLAELASPEELAELEWAWRLQRAAVVLGEHQLRRLDAEVDEAARALEVVEAAAEVRYRAHKEAVEDVRREARRLHGQKRQLSEEMGEFGGEARTAAKDIERWEKLGGKQCVTCEQTVSKNVATLAQRRAISKRDKAVQAAKELSAKVDDLEEQIAQLEEPEPPVISELDAARLLVEERDDVRGDWKSRLREEQAIDREAKKALEKAKGQGASIATRLKDMRAELSDLVEDTMTTLNRRADQLEFWVEGFGPGGLRSYLIESEIPEINRVATRYAQRLLGTGARVKLTATKTLATGESREELTVGATIPGCTQSYAGASKGQRKRLDLALLLAFREIVGRRSAKSFDQLFADELFDGLDEAGEDAVVELQREISAICPVTLVTHSDVLKNAADRLIVVHHRDGVAELEEVG